jgi:5'-3' exonuclease
MIVVLIDGKNILFRQGWAHRNLTTSEGTPSGAAYGFVNLLLRLKRKYEQFKVVVCWDGNNTHLGWRKQIYPEYKNNRKEKTEEIKQILEQKTSVIDVLQSIGILNIEVDEVEGDDVIGVITGACLNSGHEVAIYSGDQDFIQFMPLGVQVLRDSDSNGLSATTEQWVMNKFRCKSKDILKVRAIAGDSSDNIAGIQKGIGVVRAATLIANGFDPCALQVRYGANSDKANTNYNLMRIPTNAFDNNFTKGQQARLSTAVDMVLKEICKKKITKSRTNMLKILGKYELNEAIAARQVLFNL